LEYSPVRNDQLARRPHHREVAMRYEKPTVERATNIASMGLRGSRCDEEDSAGPV